jgi:hypothetical protein
MEVDAYTFQYEMGDHSNYIINRWNRHHKSVPWKK